MIFMDIQMPEMDGYEAVRAIRNSAAPNAKTIPIIAMTANVFKEDIEKCLEAGMNGHVAKPLDIEDVLAQLRKYPPKR
jgi:CheY-like chemotaxis protein